MTRSPKILLKMPNWVGDCVMATPAIAWLLDALPEAQIHAVARPGVASVLEGHPWLHRLWALDIRKASPAESEELKQQQYDAVVLFTNSLSSAWVAWKLGARHRIGYARGGRSLLLTRRLRYNKLEWQTRTPRPLSKKSIPGPRQEKPPPPHHMVAYYLGLVDAAVEALQAGEQRVPSIYTPPLLLHVTGTADLAVDQLLARHNLTGKRLIGLNPGAAYGGAKRWPVERLASVADLLATPDTAFISTASPAESPFTDIIAQHTQQPIHRLGEEVDLAGLTGLISRLALLITNDSGPMHIAAAVQTPTVAIFGPTDWNVTYPYSPHAVVVRQSPDCAPCFLRECPIDHRCMRDITAEEVARAARALLDAVSPS